MDALSCLHSEAVQDRGQSEGIDQLDSELPFTSFWNGRRRA